MENHLLKNRQEVDVRNTEYYRYDTQEKEVEYLPVAA